MQQRNEKSYLVKTLFVVLSFPYPQNKDRCWYNKNMNQTSNAQKDVMQMLHQEPFFLSLHYVYILSCHDGTLYTGYTSNLIRRLQMHNCGKGAKYTKYRTPVYLTYHEVYLSKSEALKREYKIKQLTRLQKLELIKNHCFCLIDSFLQSSLWQK